MTLSAQPLRAPVFSGLKNRYQAIVAIVIGFLLLITAAVFFLFIPALMKIGLENGLKRVGIIRPILEGVHVTGGDMIRIDRVALDKQGLMTLKTLNVKAPLWTIITGGSWQELSIGSAEITGEWRSLLSAPQLTGFNGVDTKGLASLADTIAIESIVIDVDSPFGVLRFTGSLKGGKDDKGRAFTVPFKAAQPQMTSEGEWRYTLSTDKTETLSLQLNDTQFNTAGIALSRVSGWLDHTVTNDGKPAAYGGELQIGAIKINAGTFAENLDTISVAIHPDPDTGVMAYTVKGQAGTTAPKSVFTLDGTSPASSAASGTLTIDGITLDGLPEKMGAKNLTLRGSADMTLNFSYADGVWTLQEGSAITSRQNAFIRYAPERYPPFLANEADERVSVMRRALTGYDMDRFSIALTGTVLENLTTAFSALGYNTKEFGNQPVQLNISLTGNPFTTWAAVPAGNTAAAP